MTVENRRIFANMDEALSNALGLAGPVEVTPFLLRLADQRKLSSNSNAKGAALKIYCVGSSICLKYGIHKTCVKLPKRTASL